MLHLVRGISGSGKSTLAATLAIETGLLRFEADQYFIEDGQYRFDPTRLGYVHGCCINDADNAMRYNGGAIVSNTFTTWREIKPYVKLAEGYGMMVSIVEPKTPWAKDPVECFNKNKHNVPLPAIKAQYARWLNVPIGTYEPKALLEKYDVQNTAPKAH